MDLVIKISDRCNFACDFCSSNMIASNHKDLELGKVTSFIEQNYPNCKNIIVNGGDPLCVDPKWYYDLLTWLENNNMQVNISFTTNLYDFWKNPDKWEDLFKNYVSVCTSFQYGNQRKLADGRVFTEEMFREVFKLFEDRIGYKLKFIAVVNSNTIAYCQKTVELAKELGTTCRLNPALRSGRTTRPFPFQLMMIKWLQIIELGLGDYEDNCKLIKDAWNNKVTECPFNSFCHDSIRCMSPDGTVHTCPAIADDILLGVDESYIGDTLKVKPYKDLVLKFECYQCRNFCLCNSCTKRIMDIHEMGDDWLAEHCEVMKSLIPRMQKLIGE